MPNAVRIPTSTPGAKQSTKEIHDLRGAFDTLQKQGAKGFAIGAGAAITAKAFDLVGSAIHAVGDEYDLAVQAASDLNESTSKSQVVFGNAAKTVERFGDDAAEAFGISKRAAIEASATFGNVFTGLDIGQGKAAEMSTTLVGLAGDLASFNNLDPTEALEKLRSGLAGESEPLRSVGVFMTEAKVKAKAMELGLAGAHGELSEGAKVLARYQIILDETKTAQGDFARTSNGLANSQRITNAELENTRAELGENLIPIQLEATKSELGFIKAINAAADATHASTLSRKDNANAIRDLLNLYPGLGDAIIGETADSLDAAAAADQHGDALIGVRSSATKATPAVDAAARSFFRLADDADEAKDEVKSLDSAIDNLASTIEDQLFGKAITAGNEARLKDEIKDLRKQREEVKKNAPEWTELTGEIAENQQALFDLHLEQAAKDGPKTAIRFLEQQKDKFGDATGAIQTLINKYRTLLGLQSSLAGAPLAGGIAYTGIPTIPHKKRASGGPVSAGVAYRVGEEGEETFVPKTSGTIIPHGGGMAGSMTLNVNVTGAALSPAMTDQFAREVGPALVRYMQQHGLMAGARAF